MRLLFLGRNSLMTVVTFATLLSALGLFGQLAAAADVCDTSEFRSRDCTTGTIIEDRVDVEATEGPEGSIPPRGSPPPATSNEGTDAEPPVGGDALTPNGQRFFDDFTIVGPVTIADLASFRPLTGTTHMEPNGWTIAGLPTNFWITATTHTLTGPLLDRPATVQFTPVATRYTYGDGTPTVRTPLGGSWASSGMPEFSATGTSHIYRSTGTYTVTPQVDFTVRYSYDGGAWVPVDGILTATADPLTANVVRASTVLVADDCLEAPNGPGC
jgi:hypothetical protein